MIDTRNMINGTATSLVLLFYDFYDNLMPFLLLGIVLIIADTRFGAAAAKKRGENIINRIKWRRAINKFIDYVCWVTLAGVFGHAYGKILGIPILSALILLIVYGIEITSCFNNYFESKGIKKKINIFKLIRPDINSAIEDVPEKEKEEENDNK